MAKWRFDQEALVGGRMQLIVQKLTKGGVTKDVTYFRGAPTQLENYSSSDPFGDSTAVFTFPAITGFDDLDSADIGNWLADYSNVDLWWIPGVPATGAPGEVLVTNPLTGLRDVITPSTGSGPRKLFEGFIASMDLSGGDTEDQLQIQCQGANFQLDSYLQKPFYPRRPYPMELLIADAFDHTRKPHLRTRPLQIQFPTGWTKKVPRYTGAPTIYTPVATPGSNWTGFTSRATGAWDRTLTGFVQDQISSMLVDENSGVTPGNQWTVMHQHGSATSPGRQPVLQVRDRFRAPDFSFWYGTPGFKFNPTRDTTQSNNLLYGDGTGIDGTVWRNAVISNDGSRTDYLPLAAARDIYPFTNNPAFNKGAFAKEGYLKFGPGFAQDIATSSSEKTLARDQMPGWAGTAVLKIDPSEALPRWLIRAGMTVLIKGFIGSGEAGIPFHIAAVSANPMTGDVTLTLDTRYRDLLSIEEALVRARDPLTPSKMLQINRASAVIEDVQAPWDYTAGSGYIPKASKAFFDYCPATTPFPYTDWRQKHPPLHYPSWYTKVVADAPTRAGRWAGPVPILTSEKGTIRRSEFVACDVYGRPLKVPFHVSLYYVNVTVAAMPRDGGGPSPYIDGAFESVNPLTGEQWPAGNFYAPDPSIIIGWGNRSGGVFNRAGFWPAREDRGAGPSGLMVDEATWAFDNTNNPNFNKLAKPGQKQSQSAITIYAMFYCEFTEPVYFLGRLFRQEQGT